MTQLLIILQGAPGSGKTTLGKQIASVIDGEIFSTDDLFIENGVYKFDASKLGLYHKINLERAIEAMKAKKNVVIDNTNLKAWESFGYVKAAVDMGIIVKFVRAIGNFQNTHGVPDEKVETMRNSIEELSVEKVLRSGGLKELAKDKDMSHE
jgi:adenylate kinase family enzyme